MFAKYQQQLIKHGIFVFFVTSERINHDSIMLSRQEQMVQTVFRCTYFTFIDGYTIKRAFSHGTGPMTALTLAHRRRRAFSGPMECTLTLLPQSYCSHCTGAQDLVNEAPWDRKDYAQKEFTDLDGDIKRQGLQSEPEVPVGSVHPREIYGIQTAVKLGKALRSL